MVGCCQAGAGYGDHHSTVQSALGGPSWRLVLFYCFVVSLVAPSCRAGKSFIQTAAPPTPSGSICGSILQQQWVGGHKFTIIPKAASF